MACKCEFPITVEEVLRGWSGEQSIQEYCGNCGEVFGSERQFVDRKRKRKPRPKKRREQGEEVAPLHKLQVGDKLVVTAVYRKSYPWTTQDRRRWLWMSSYWIPSEGVAVRLSVGAQYRVVRHAWRGWYVRPAKLNQQAVMLEEVGVPHKRRFLVCPQDIAFRPALDA